MGWVPGGRSRNDIQFPGVRGAFKMQHLRRCNAYSLWPEYPAACRCDAEIPFVGLREASFCFSAENLIIPEAAEFEK
jgi:hypothetical protein